MQRNEVIGQQEVWNRLMEMVQENRLPHALMFCGPQGCGKLAMALAFASYLLGDSPMLRKWEHPDLHFTFPTIKTANMGSEHKPVSLDFIKEWRELLLSKGPYIQISDWMLKMGKTDADYNKQAIITAEETDAISHELMMMSSQGGYKISLIWLPERMNIQSANKILKLLEPNLNELENQKSFGNNTNSFDNIDDSDFPEEIEYVEDKIEGFDFPEEPEEEFEFDSDENEEYVVDDEDEIDKSMITNENKKLNIIAIVVSVVIVIGIVIAAIILTKSFGNDNNNNTVETTVEVTTTDDSSNDETTDAVTDDSDDDNNDNSNYTTTYEKSSDGTTKKKVKETTKKDKAPTKPKTTKAPKATPKPTEAPKATEPPATEPPATEPPVTDASADEKVE